MSLLVAYNNLLQPIRLIPSIIQSVAGTGTGTDTFTVTPTSTPITGNLMVIIAGGAQTRSVTTPPSGFTALTQQGVTAATTNRIFYKFATASEPSSYTVVWGGGTLSGGASFIEVQDVDRSNPVNLHVGTGSAVSVTTLAIPSYNITNVGFAVTFIAKSGTSTWAADNDFDNIAGAGQSRKETKIYRNPATGEITTWTGTSETGNADLVFFNGKVLGYTP